MVLFSKFSCGTFLPVFIILFPTLSAAADTAAALNDGEPSLLESHFYPQRRGPSGRAGVVGGWNLP